VALKIGEQGPLGADLEASAYEEADLDDLPALVRRLVADLEARGVPVEGFDKIAALPDQKRSRAA
jgi:hypothetical protein